MFGEVGCGQTGTSAVLFVDVCNRPSERPPTSSTIPSTCSSPKRPSTHRFLPTRRRCSSLSRDPFPLHHTVTRPSQIPGRRARLQPSRSANAPRDSQSPRSQARNIDLQDERTLRHTNGLSYRVHGNRRFPLGNDSAGHDSLRDEMGSGEAEPGCGPNERGTSIMRKSRVRRQDDLSTVTTGRCVERVARGLFTSYPTEHDVASRQLLAQPSTSPERNA